MLLVEIRVMGIQYLLGRYGFLNVNDKLSGMVASIFNHEAIPLTVVTIAVFNMGLTSSFIIMKQQLLSLS